MVLDLLADPSVREWVRSFVDWCRIDVDDPPGLNGHLE